MTTLIAALIAFSFGTFNVQSTDVQANDVQPTLEISKDKKGDDGVGMGEVGGGMWDGGGN